MRGLFLITATLALVSCASGPDYRRPQAPIPAALGEVTGVGDAPEVKLAEWPAYFADPALIEFIRLALEHNRDLRVATARVEEARALYGIRRADQLPSFDLNAEGASSRVPAPLSATGQSTIQRRYDVNLGLLAYELDFWGRVRRLSEAALANYLATEEAQRAFRLSLIAEVANTYYTVRALDERAQFALRTAETREESLRVVSRRFDAGAASRLDVLQAQAALETARADAALLARQAANARHAFGVLVGEMTAAPAVTGAALDDLPLPPPAPAGLPSSVLLRRPDVLAAEHSLVAANANVGAARAAFFPRVTLVGSAGVASNELDDLFGGDRRAWSFLPSISLPIFHGGRNRANLNVAQARNVIAIAQYEQAIQQAFREAADVLSDQAWLAAQHAAQQRLVAHQSERVRLATARYEAGLVGYLEVLDAQREHYAAQQVLIDIKRARLAAAAQAYKVLGGT